MLESLAALYCRGARPSWSALQKGKPRRKVTLPTYPFQRERYWVAATAQDFFPPANDSHPLLGQRLQLPLSKEIRFAVSFSASTPPLLDEHRLFGVMVVAAATHLSMFLSAAEKVFGTASCLLDELFFLRPLIVPDEGEKKLQLRVMQEENAAASLQLISLAAGGDPYQSDDWATHVTGRISRPGSTTGAINLTELQGRCQDSLSGTDFYQQIWSNSEGVGPSFRWIQSIWKGRDEAICQAQVPMHCQDVQDYLLHPGLIEACFQTLHFCRQLETVEDMQETHATYVPFSISALRLFTRPVGKTFWCYARLREPERVPAKSVVGDFTLFDEAGGIIAEIQGFELRKLSGDSLQGSEEMSTVKDWYQLAWEIRERHDRLTTAPDTATGHWLVFADPDSIAWHLAAKLEAQGESCTLVRAGDAYLGEGQRSYTLNPECADDFVRLLEDQACTETLRGVVFAWGRAETKSSPPSLASLQAAQHRGCAGALHLVQALLKKGLPSPPRIWILTEQTQVLDGIPGPLWLGQAPLWGLGRVIAQEHPELACTCIDLEATGPADPPQALLDELRAPASDAQIAYRTGVRYVAKLLPYAGAASDTLTIDSNGSYLITGGMGTHGLAVAQWLAKQGAGSILLAGARAAVQGVDDALAYSETNGQIKLLESDLTQADTLKNILLTLSTDGLPLKGIIHMAGIMDDGILMQQNWPRFRAAMVEKVTTAWHLHNLTKETPLDFFVCFSSSASMLGTAGQASYAAANAFLDLLACHRQALGLKGLSINWGPWAEVGAAAELDDVQKDRLREQGWEPLSTERGLQALGELLAQDAPQVGVLPLRTVDDSKRDRSQAARKVTQPNRHQSTVNHDEGQEMLAYLQEAVAIALGTPQAPDVHEPLINMGLDSLIALSLRNKILSDWGVDVPMAELIDGSSISDLAASISQQ